MTICAWCGSLLEEGSGPVSHGICPSCSEGLLSQQRANLRRYLDLFDEPVALVDGEAAVVAAGRGLGTLVNRDPEELTRLTPGELLDCASATDAGGCGSDRSCESCGLRSAVRSTFQSGEPIVRAVATVRQRVGGELRFAVTTERFGNAVLLRLDGPRLAPPGMARR